MEDFQGWVPHGAAEGGDQKTSCPLETTHAKSPGAPIGIEGNFHFLVTASGRHQVSHERSTKHSRIPRLTARPWQAMRDTPVWIDYHDGATA